jgi:hypothetical protein
MHRLRLALLATLFVVVGCRTSGSGPGPAAGLDDPPLGSAAASTVEHDVEVAYLHSWDVYAKALRTLSTDGLEESFAGPALDSTVAEVNRLRAAGTPVSVVVDHGTTIEIRGTSAAVRDALVNHSVLLDPATAAAVEPDPRSPHVSTYTLEVNGGRWRVTYIAQAS